jgi:protein-S-isoprenylcysteine O-methyltransferase Ste14
MPMPFVQKVKSTLLRISGYLIPFIQQIPALGIYTGLMTLPVFLYLVLLITQVPLNPPWEIQQLLSSIPGLIIIGLIIGGIILVLYSAIYLHLHRHNGLVTTGPYRFIRHPQYTGFLLFTLGLTAWSYIILSTTFGTGWLTPQGTFLLWFAQLTVYILLAFIEESYLTKTFGDTYTAYKQHTPAFLPFRKIGLLELPLSLILFTGLLTGLIFFGLFPTLPFNV